jgi:transposase
VRDIDFFAKLLSLKRPWKVERVSISPEEREIDVWLEHRRHAEFVCPECRLPLPVFDHVGTRRWRHLDHGGFLTWLHARIPRVYGLEHGARQAGVPWALPGSRFTLPFERHAIDVLLETDVLGGARVLKLSWDEAWHLMERAVERAKRRRSDA